MLCRLLVTCALLGHVVLSLPAARAPRYTPLPDEVDSDETRRVLGSSVVTSVSVIMDLGNGSQALFSQSPGNHHEENKDSPAIPTFAAENHLSPEKRPVGSPPALLSPDRYEFYTFDESGELVRRLMTLEQIQSLIAGGDDANRIAAIPLPVEIDTVPSPLATDPQGQVVASVQQVLAEELLASTMKNGTEPHEVEVEAEVQEMPPSSSETGQVEEGTPVKVSTEAEEEEQKISSTTHMPTESFSTEISSTSEVIKEQEKPVEIASVPSETRPQEETYSEMQTTMRPSEVEISTGAPIVSEEKIPDETTEINTMQEVQSPIEAATEETSMFDEAEGGNTPLKFTTDKQEEPQEYLTSSQSPIASESEMVDDVKESTSTEATVQEVMITTDASEVSIQPEITVQESEKVPEFVMDTVKEEGVTVSPSETSNETEKTEEAATEGSNQLPGEDEKVPVETETVDKIPQEDEVLVPLMGEKPEESGIQTPMEISPEIQPSEMADTMDDDTTPTNQAYTPSTGMESDIKDVVEETMPPGIVEEIPSPIPIDSQILEEADLSGITDDLSLSKPMETPLEDGQMDAEKNPVVLEMEPATPEAPVLVEIQPEIPAMIPSSVAQEISTAIPTQGSSGDKEEAEDSEEDDDSLLDQLAESVSSVLSQVTGLDDEDYDDDFRKKPLTTTAPSETTEQVQEVAATTDSPATEIANEENKQEEGEKPYTDSIIPDMRDPTKDHTVPSVETEKPTDFGVEKEVTTVPAVSSDEKVFVTEETIEQEEGMKEESAAEETTTVVTERIQDEFVPITTTDSNQEMPMTTERAEMPSLVSSTEIPKDDEDIAPTEAFEKESESTTTKFVSQQKVDSSATGIMNDDDEKYESLPVTESGVDNYPVTEGDSGSTDKSKLAEVEVKETMEIESVPAEQPNYITTLKPQMEEVVKDEEEKVEGMKNDEIEEEEMKEEGMKGEEMKVEEMEEEGMKGDGMKEEEMKEEEMKEEEMKDEEMKDEEMKDEEMKEDGMKEGEIKEQQQMEETDKMNEHLTEHHEEETTASIIMHSTEKMEEVEEVQTTVKPVDENHDLTAPNNQPEDDGVEAVKGVQADLLLIENLHKEAALNREPLLPGNDPPEDITHIPTKAEEPTTVSHPIETSSQGIVYQDDVVIPEVTSSSPAEEARPSEELKPSDLAAAVEEEAMETEAPTTDTKIEEESIKPTMASDLEHPTDISDKDTTQNPWTKIPIPLVHHTSTTPESEKYPSPSTPSNSDTDDLLFSSPAPDDLPDPNGLLPLLTEKPSPSTTFIPSSTNNPVTEKPINTGEPSTGQQASTTGGTVVPPLMSAFPPAPNGNSGLESTSASTDPDVKRFVDLCNDLAFALYGQVTSGAAASSVPATRGANGGGVQTRSLVVSPFAITSLLAMVFLGARGRTAEEMNDLLRLDDMVTFNPHQVLFNVTESVISSPGVSAAAFVRELYSDKANGKLLDFYKARANAFYNGHVEEVDFKDVNDVLRRRTNHLVRWQTRGRVPEYLRGSSLKLRSPLAALSANFFEADCQRASSTGSDGEMYFEVPATGRRRRRLVPVPAVVWRGVFLAGHDPGLDATVLELRHGGGEVSTVLVLPGRHGQSIEAADVSGGLTRLETWLVKGGRESWSALLRSALPRGPMEVQLPRFAHRSVLNATGALSRMGLQHLFQDGKADLGGLNGGLGGKLHLADIIQMTAFGVCADDGSSKRHLETYPSAQRTGRRHTRSLLETSAEERPDRPREARTAWVDELAREEENSYVFAAAAAARELPLAVRPRQARIPRPALKQQTRVVLPRLRFDRPFLYFVRHNPSGFILLMGRFNPRLFP
ncbi:hypothetical protein J437_LFUL001357 [Ladona fulva]|uniref:Serpin domain-containing protein n=1 Tax=Ladona fulva TaxID=123851 RepID=A0A8K0JW96_LADFU|nr:hypothetical protein J437_LFUL001357 [Ladona fulva]